jgi:hypothetical protein
MDYERLRPVLHNGALVALAGPRRFHIIAPWLQDRGDDDEELRHVALLCAYHQQVIRGALPDSGDPSAAERWVAAFVHETSA